MSTSSAVKKSYHHGGLREAAIETGLAMLESRAIDDIGLREVARAVGVSATALYRYFPDKAALLASLAAEGLKRLGTAQRVAQEGASNEIEGFNATGRAYVRFALANPALFRLIFSSRPQPDVLSTGLVDGPIHLLRTNATSLLDQDEAGSEAATILSIRAWGLVHGLALLMLDGLVPADDHLIDATIDATSLIAGMRRRGNR